MTVKQLVDYLRTLDQNMLVVRSFHSDIENMPGPKPDGADLSHSDFEGEE